MKYFGIFLIVIVIVILASVFITKELSSNSEADNARLIEKSKKELIAADKAFYKESLIKGTGRAFIDFAANEVILMRQKQFPVMGKQALEQLYQNKDTVALPLKWEPVKAEVSPDGKLGYTFGNWQYTEVDDNGNIDRTYGNYVTIWQKQTDGSWKYVLDGGTTTPAPDTVNSRQKKQIY